MSGRSKPHLGTYAIAVASLLCGAKAAMLPLDAQPLSLPADQPAKTEPRASFEERFSPDRRAEPLFTRPKIQSLLASLPPSLTDALVAGAEPAAPEPEPQPAENTASVTTQAPGPETTPFAPILEAQLPEFPPPPSPADVVLPSAEELAAAAPPQAPPQSLPDVSGMGRSELGRQAEISKPSNSQPPVEKKRVERQAACVKRQATEDHPAMTGSVSHCRTGAACVSQQQTFAIFFGFIAGALLGGPIGAIAGGTGGALMTAPDAQRTRSDPALRR